MTRATRMAIAAPVQKTVLIPSGLCPAQLARPLGTFGWFVTTSREYLLLHASTTWPTARVTISGLSRSRPTKMPFASPTATPTPRHARIAGAIRWSEPAPTPAIRLPPREITPGVDRSIPPCMTTSICPIAASARTDADGNTYDHDVLPRTSGAANAATITSAAVASQIGRNRAVTRAFAASVRPDVRANLPSEGGDEGRAATTTHSEQVRRTLSMLTERALGATDAAH